jgi:hypothetical protein
MESGLHWARRSHELVSSTKQRRDAWQQGASMYAELITFRPFMFPTLVEQRRLFVQTQDSPEQSHANTFDINFMGRP